ncbi:hypothetical protein CHU98_g5307 [Xylaria longipes]|nr:hypothetical protein CHU98_g5307 [Xylaria longipes]
MPRDYYVIVGIFMRLVLYPKHGIVSKAIDVVICSCINHYLGIDSALLRRRNGDPPCLREGGVVNIVTTWKPEAASDGDVALSRHMLMHSVVFDVIQRRSFTAEIATASASPPHYTRALESRTARPTSGPGRANLGRKRQAQEVAKRPAQRAPSQQRRRGSILRCYLSLNHLPLAAPGKKHPATSLSHRPSCRPQDEARRGTELVAARCDLGVAVPEGVERRGHGCQGGVTRHENLAGDGGWRDASGDH